MLNLPIPRRSFLDSRLRCQSHETRRLIAGSRKGESHLGHGIRAASPAPPSRDRFQSRLPLVH